MHERVKHIMELVRNGVKVRIITLTSLLDNDEKLEAIEYLQDDDKIIFEIHPLNDEETLIEIEMIQNDE